MTNLQYLVLLKLKEKLQAISGLNFVGIYPDDLDKIGQRFPAAMIKDSDEDIPQFNAGKQVRIAYTVKVIIYHELRLGYARIKDVLDLQIAVVNAVTSGLMTLDGTVTQCNGYSVAKGDLTPAPLADGSGYSGEVTQREIVFTFTLYDNRS
jgi:hypothetical protein